MPPIPTPTIFTTSLGALYPLPPSTCLGTIVKADAVKAAPFTKLLLLKFIFLPFEIFFLFIIKND
jgi:hypothetical protein